MGRVLCSGQRKGQLGVLPCHNARGAIENAAKMDKDSKAALAFMEANDLEAWYATVRAVRVRDSPGEPETTVLSHKHTLVTQVVNDVKQVSAVRETTKVPWFNKNNVIAYDMQW